jgi:superfamily II DNA or RNA helicase
LHHPLLPYQREGMLHLAFGERTLLADEMGLGKTVQAIAACELLARRKGIERVLVVCPASLKAEWEEQIARFTDRAARPVFGARPARLAAYREPTFFTIVNYEQVLGDAPDINEILHPDVVVLDEAQRIKNWQIKTARRVKSLRSPFAFVLTGTPVENRIDELYSIVQYLDPELVGPLFRFNRDFYELDERGRPVDYKNLAELRRRLQPVMLRRRKSDVEAELPGRMVKTYFVPMAEEQALRYADYSKHAASLLAQARRRPLTPKEFERLQMLLACMRMICDTPAILDPTCRVSPKLEELEGILSDLLEEPERKIIVFSEWERMLEMVRELAGELGVEVAWHTGSVPQQRRRAEIVRFKQDPACRLFLSTDSGSVGLNLQVASAVVNVDLPWNPAKLEQRIARAWRKNQTRSVTVVNLVCEDSIEHQILHLLGHKQALADGVLDGQGDLGALKMPSGRAAMIERMEAMMQAQASVAPRILSPEEAVAEELRRRHGERALLIEARTDGDGHVRLLVVLDLDGEALAAEAKWHEARCEVGPAVEVIDRPAWLAMRRLAASGMITLTQGSPRVLHQLPDFAAAADPSYDPEKRSIELRGEAERSLRMARVLAAGGFPEEALPLTAKAIGIAAAARLAELGELPAGVSTATPAQIRDLVDRGAFASQAEAALSALWSTAGGRGVGDIISLIDNATLAVAGINDRKRAKAA